MSPHLESARGAGSSARNVVSPIPPATGDFADRIMATIAQESAPTPARTFLSAARGRSVRDAASVLWVAWHLGTVRSWRIAPGVRVRSIALVLAVAAVLGTGSLATAAALRVAAEPVVDLFQSGIDEQGPVENDPPDIDQQHELQDADSGVSQPGGDNLDNDQPGVNQPGVNQPGGENADHGQPGTDHSSAGDGAGGDQSGVDQPGGQHGGDNSGDNSGDNNGDSSP